MLLSEVKERLSVRTLEFVRSTVDQEVNGKIVKTPTPWLRHWDNVNRFAVVAHEDVIAKLKANPNQPCALKSEFGVMPKNGAADAKPYDNHILICPNTIEEVL
jgi:hypothetical protein